MYVSDFLPEITGTGGFCDLNVWGEYMSMFVGVRSCPSRGLAQAHQADQHDHEQDGEEWDENGNKIKMLEASLIF